MIFLQLSAFLMFLWINAVESQFSVVSFLQPNYITSDPAGGYKYVTGDFNGDGITDMVHLCGSNYVHVWTGLGNGQFSVNGAFSPSSGYELAGAANGLYKFLVGDVNGDGKDDMVHMCCSAYFHIWVSNGDGTFTVLRQDQGSYDFSSPAVTFKFISGDFNGDGIMDMVHLCCTNYVHVWLGLGTGYFTVKPAYSPSSDYDLAGPANGLYKFLIGDVNSDGKDDMVHFCCTGYFHIWISNGDGTFTILRQDQSNYDFALPAVTFNFLPGDFNGDGVMDMVHLCGPDHVYFWFGYGNGYFAVSAAYYPSSGYSIAGANGLYKYLIGDYNGDGYDDLAHICCSSYMHTWFSNGNGHFTLQTTENDVISSNNYMFMVLKHGAKFQTLQLSGLVHFRSDSYYVDVWNYVVITVPPTPAPSVLPTLSPSAFPTSQPSMKPSSQPTSQPSRLPSAQPTLQPSSLPSSLPTVQPIALPSSQPSGFPSSQPSTVPSSRPSPKPTTYRQVPSITTAGKYYGTTANEHFVINAEDEEVVITGGGGSDEYQIIFHDGLFVNITDFNLVTAGGAYDKIDLSQIAGITSVAKVTRDYQTYKRSTLITIRLTRTTATSMSAARSSSADNAATSMRGPVGSAAAVAEEAMYVVLHDKYPVYDEDFVFSAAADDDTPVTEAASSETPLTSQVWFKLLMAIGVPAVNFIFFLLFREMFAFRVLDSWGHSYSLHGKRDTSPNVSDKTEIAIWLQQPLHTQQQQHQEEGRKGGSGPARGAAGAGAAGTGQHQIMITMFPNYTFPMQLKADESMEGVPGAVMEEIAHKLLHLESNDSALSKYQRGFVRDYLHHSLLIKPKKYLRYLHCYRELGLFKGFIYYYIYATYKDKFNDKVALERNSKIVPLTPIAEPLYT